MKRVRLMVYVLAVAFAFGLFTLPAASAQDTTNVEYLKKLKEYEKRKKSGRGKSAKPK